MNAITGLAVCILISILGISMNFRRYLPEETYQLYLKTFPDSSYENFRKAIKVSCGLFRETAVSVAKDLGGTYPEEYERGFQQYVEIMKFMKRDEVQDCRENS